MSHNDNNPDDFIDIEALPNIRKSNLMENQNVDDEEKKENKKKHNKKHKPQIRFLFLKLSSF